MFRMLFAVLICAAMTSSTAGASQSNQTGSGPRVRTYYVAADEVEWDHAPGGANKMMGMKFEGWGEMFTKSGPHVIGRERISLHRANQCEATLSRGSGQANCGDIRRGQMRPADHRYQ